jgi:parvulin-like peptidyl-prolyl isomerase
VPCAPLLAAAVAFFGPVTAAAAPCVVGAAVAQAAAAQSERSGPAASARGAELSWAEFHELVLDRHAMSQVGREALQHLVRARLLDRLASESKLVIPERELDAKLRELEAEVKRAGEAGSLDEYLAAKRVPKPKFREFLRLGLVQERLARRALGIADNRPINAEQQEMWLDQIVQQRGLQTPPPPWKDGVVARCGDLEIKLGEFLPHLVEQLTSDDVDEDCHRALLAKLAQARMPDLSSEALERALDDELARRRAAALNDPKTKGLSFEQLLAAQGLTVDVLRRDPAVRSAALAHVWVERNFGEAGLRRVYDEERALFDARFGEAYETRAIFLRGAKFTNEFNPRTFEDAERELERLAPQIKSREDFERFAKLRSEDPATRERGGLLGYITAGDENAPEPLRTALFVGGGSPDRLVGPVRIPAGVLLAWAGPKRPTPGWELMREHVHNELRRRFIEETLPEADVLTFLEMDAYGGRK